MYLAENIKYLREQAGMTQQEFAEKLGISRSALSLYEIGEREAELSKIIRIAELFKVSLDELILRKLKPPVSMYISNIKYLRKQHGLTQEYMADMFGYKDKSSWCLIEKGETQVSVELIVQLADFFNVTVDDLLRKDLSQGGA